MSVENMGRNQNVYRSAATGQAWQGVDTTRSTSGSLVVGRRVGTPVTALKPLRLRTPKKTSTN